jgi:phosphatidylinositol alpha-1,6-mannosyltransferase
MRITFVAGRYWPATGGAEMLIRHVARELSARHDVTVIAHRIDEGPIERLSDSLRHPAPFQAFADGNAHVVPVEISTARRLALLPLGVQVTPGLRRYAFGRLRIPLMELYERVVSAQHMPHVRDADIVHIWATSFVGAAALRAAEMAGKPAVMTPFVHPGQWGDDIAARRLYRRADRIVGLLENERETFRAMGIPDARIETCGVCAHGVRTAGADELRARYRVEGRLVLFLGVRRPYKGHDLLLAAANHVEQRMPGVTFAFVGPGPALNLDGVAARVLDVGRVDEHERGAWLASADVMCLPSAHELFPVSILEAWSAHTPVVVSDLLPLVELVERSGGGVTSARDPVALAAVLTDLLGRPDTLRRLADSGFQFWRSGHTPAAVAACHEKLYEDVLSGLA